MANEAYKDWYEQGLQAMKSATEQSKANPSDMSDVISSPELKEIMTAGSKAMTQHAQNIAQLLERAGGTSNGMPNVIMEGLRAGSKQMIQAAKDPAVRDASIIAASQLTIHYFIAAYGTLASTAKHLGLEEDAKMLKEMADQMKAGDERFTEIAKSSVNQQAQSAA